MRYFYSFLFYLALPYLIARLYWRSLRQPAYRQRIPERFGFYPVKFEKSLWVHAASVGEAFAAVPLINALKIDFPDLPVVVTTMTPTGAARIKTALGDRVTQVYIPYDLPDAVRRFLQAMHPVMAIIMETELWPNLLAACHQRQIPVCLANARLSEKSAKGYQRIASLTREMLQSLTLIAAQGKKDAERLIALGAPKERVRVSGNIKFDLELPQELTARSAVLRDQLGCDRFTWIAASTHEGEEDIVLAAHQQLREKNENALLILVPRHPDRFNAIAKLCEQSFRTVRRSQSPSSVIEAAVYLGDTMGELLLLYGAADVAFVGGSFIPQGGHNILEPGALGKPILTGPHLFNFAEISELFFSNAALTIVHDAPTLVNELMILMQNEDERKQRGMRALRVVEANRGALARQLQLIQCLLRDGFTQI